MELISTKCILYLIFTASHFTLFDHTVSIMCVGPVAVEVIPGGNYPRNILLDFSRDICYRN